MVYSIGFTASRNIIGVSPSFWGNHLSVLNADVYITGGCFGGDSVIGKTLLRLFPSAIHLIVVPGDTSKVDFWWQRKETNNLENIKIYWMPEDSSYKDRNQKIVTLSNEIIGFPEYDEADSRSLRSGTWQTIRLATKAIKKTSIYLTRDYELRRTT